MNTSAFWKGVGLWLNRLFPKALLQMDPVCGIPALADGWIGNAWLCLSQADEPSAGNGARLSVAVAVEASRGPSVADLYRKYSPSLYWVCLRYTRNKDDAEDMVQQTFFKIHQNLDGFKGKSSLYTWIYRIAVNECMQMLRKRKFESKEELPDLEETLSVFPESGMDAKLTLQRIVAATDSETVEILSLLYLEGLKQKEVVEVMGISRTTVNRKVAAFKIHVKKFR